MHNAPREKSSRPARHWILIFLALGLATTVVLTYFAGTAQTLALLANANLFFVAGIIASQGLRYVAMTLTTYTVAEIVNVRVPRIELFQTTVAAQAANRTFFGGAGGIVIRLTFFLKHGMQSGTFAAVEGIEDVVSLCAVALMFISGLAIVVISLSSRGATNGFRWDAIGSVIFGAVALAFIVIYIVQHPLWVERGIDGLARGVNRILAPITHRNFYNAERVHGGVNDFYRALALARRDPLRVFIAFCCAFARLGSDWFALFFAFHAIGYDVPLGTVLLIFIVSTSVATIAAVPGQLGVMETALTFMSTALGIPAPVAVSATVLFRVISFWLPIPFGYAFAWNLERRGLL